MDKEWLFEENIRLNKLEQELAEKNKILKLEQEKLAGEKRVFEQQKKVLEMGFQKLAADKEMFRDEVKKQKAEEKAVPSGVRGPGFFGGVSGYSSLKKRYKELMKIFHPDNKNGDAFTVACINKEYEILKDQYKK
ncbi:MAG: J domain-containing protein [Lachnospiraceae bacterium]